MWAVSQTGAKMKCLACRKCIRNFVQVSFATKDRQCAEHHITDTPAHFSFSQSNILKHTNRYWGFDNLFDIFLPGIQLNYPEAVAPLVDLPTFVANVGPFSSMHDRACEVYASIHGELTDFGYFHAQQFGHSRFGRDFTSQGSYFNQGRLGEIGEDGNVNRVHIIAHSFGGNTARYLERLLHEGLPSEQGDMYPQGEPPMSDLFASGRQPQDGGWIRSIIALATPFDGSTLHTRLGKALTNALERVVFAFIGFADLLGSDFDLIYDADLDHFGLNRQPGESASEFWRRIFSAPFFDPDFADSAEYDLSPMAQFLFNQAGPRAYPGTYYLAYATHQTNVVLGGACSGRAGSGYDATINSETEAIMQFTARIMGDLTDARVEDGNQCFEEEVYKACNANIPVSGPWNLKGYEGWCADNSYEQNDGLVPFRCSTGPTFGLPWNDGSRPMALGLETQEADDCSAWSTLSDGQWYFVEIGVDHTQIIGWRTEWTLENVNNVYLRDIPHHINRIKTNGDPEGYICCQGEWCVQSTFDPPSPYPDEEI